MDVVRGAAAGTGGRTRTLLRSLRFVAKILYEIMLDRVSMLDETVETRRPWRGSPRPCVLAGAFLRCAPSGARF